MRRLVWFVLATVTATASVVAARSAPPLPVLGEVPTFSFEDQDGNRIGNAELLGHVWVADFIFTQCTTACPMLSARMALLQRGNGDPAVRFVSFSVDPEHDTPAVLKDYAQRWRKDPRWHLLATTRRTLPPLVRRLGVVAQQTGDPDDPIIHSNGFLLIDGSGLVRGMYSNEDPAQLKRLAADLDRLSRAHAAPATARARDGAQLFQELGCAGCHADPHLASPLGGLFGRTIKLTDGRAVKVDEAYLRESILVPDAKLAAGYPASMPSYRTALTDSQVDALVAYVRSLPATSAGQRAEGARQLVIDPVCKMQISAGPDTRHLERAGRTHYFCSDACRDKFEKDPARYAP